MARQELWQTTRWSLVRRAKDREDVDASNRALSDLIESYREPVTACLRRRLRGHPRVDDAVDAFWGWIFEGQVLAKLRDGVKFRASMQWAVHYYALEWRRSDRILAGDAEEAFDIADPTEELGTLEDENSWASAILERALTALEHSTERGAALLELRYGLRGKREASPKDMEKEFGTNSNAINQAVDRARRKLRELLLSELADMTGSEAEFEEERDVLIHRLLEGNPALSDVGLLA